VTFDDGYANNFLNALPILAALRVPATIFLATAFLDGDRPFPFDDWQSAGSSDVPADAWRPLSSEECRSLLASGLIELGAHTHTHQVFLERVDEFRRDLADSVEVLRDRFGLTQPSFAFPFGMSNAALIEVAKQSGVACALSTQPECNRITADPFQWGRFDVAESDTAATLAAKLTGWYTLVARALVPLKRPLQALAQLSASRSRGGALAARSP
jgi:peptidoglycan/xylan/chitin deacetylase (PgdA/CDA1 family)